MLNDTQCLNFNDGFMAKAGSQLKALSGGMELLTLLSAISIAALFGLVHAVMPGHGKTVLVSYFLGRPAKITTGFAASVILVLAHVGSAVVLVLSGFILISAQLVVWVVRRRWKPLARCSSY